MRKTILLGIVFLLCMSLVTAINECDTQINQDTDCRITTPSNIICSSPTYIVYNQTGQKDVNGGAMTELASGSGVYYATFNYHSLGVYTIVVCNNLSTAHLTVINTTSSDPLFGTASDILGKVSNITSGSVTNNNYDYTYNQNITEYLINGTNMNITAYINTSSLDEIQNNTNNSNQIYIFLFLFGLVFIILGYVIENSYIKTISGMIFTVIGIYIIRYGFYGLTNEFIQYAVMTICMGIGFYLMIDNIIKILGGSMD